MDKGREAGVDAPIEESPQIASLGRKSGGALEGKGLAENLEGKPSLKSQKRKLSGGVAEGMMAHQRHDRPRRKAGGGLKKRDDGGAAANLQAQMLSNAMNAQNTQPNPQGQKRGGRTEKRDIGGGTMIPQGPMPMRRPMTAPLRSATAPGSMIQRPGGLAPVVPGMRKDGGGADKWIAGAVKKPGSFTKSAEHAGKTVHEFAEEHKHDSDKTGKRARLALTFQKMAHKKD